MVNCFSGKFARGVPWMIGVCTGPLSAMLLFTGKAIGPESFSGGQR